MQHNERPPIILEKDYGGEDSVKWRLIRFQKERARKTIARLYELLELQEKVEKRFGIDGYNVFVFGSYVTIHYVEGKSDIDIAIYTEDFDLYKRISMYLEEYFAEKELKVIFSI